MPYIKRKYVNGLYAPMQWYEQLNTPKPWYYDLKTSDDFSVSNQLKTINNFDWKNQLKTVQDLGFTGIKYEYKPSKNDSVSNDMLSNFNDTREINSFRDIVLGSVNPNMKHNLRTGVGVIDNNAVYNMLTDTIMHSWKHYLKPMFTGHGDYALSNLMVEARETLDAVANPIKAIPISIAKGENPFQALLRSTFGDETGIHTYEYDTGNGLVDFILELISDPLNWASFGGKSLISASADAGLEGAGKVLTRKGVKELAQELTEATGKRVTQKAVRELVEATPELQKTLRWQTAFWHSSDMAKKGVLNAEIQDEILKAMQKKYTKVFTKRLASTLDLSADTLSEAVQRGLMEGVEKITKKSLLKMSADVTTSMGLKMVALDDVVSGFLLHHGLDMTGIRQVYLALKKDSPVRIMLDNMVMAKATQNIANRVIEPMESFLKSGNYDGAFEVLQKHINLKNLDPDLAKATADTPEELLGPLATQFKIRIAHVQEAIMRLDTTADLKEQEVLSYFQSLFSFIEIKSMDDAIKLVDVLDAKAAQVGSDTLLDSAFASIKRAVNKIADDIEDYKQADKIKNFIKTQEPTLKISKDIEQFNKLNTGRDFNIHKFVKRTPLTRAHLTIKEFPVHALDGLLLDEFNPKINSQNVNIVETLLLDLKQVLTANNSYPIKYLKDDFSEIIRLIDSTFEDIDALVEYMQHIKKIMPNYYENKFAYIIYTDMLMKQSNLVNKLTDDIFTLQDTIEYMRKYRFAERISEHMIDPIFYDLVFPKDITGIRTYNSDLIDILKNTKYTPEFPGDFTKTKTYRYAQDAIRQNTKNENTIATLENKLKTSYKYITEEMVKANEKRVSKVAELSEAAVVKDNTIIKHSSQTMAKKAAKAIRSSSILSYDNAVKLNKYLDTIEEAITNHLEAKPFKQELFLNDTPTIMKTLKINIDNYRRYLRVLAETNDVKYYKGLYIDLYNTHLALTKSLWQVRRYLDNASILDPKNLGIDMEELRGVLASDQPIIFKELIIEHYDKNGNLITDAMLEKIPAKEVVDTKTYFRYFDSITGTEYTKEFADRVTHTNMPIREEAYKLLASNKIIEANKALKELEDIMYMLNPEIDEASYIEIMYDTYYARLKLENSVVRGMFNNLESLNKLREDVYMRRLTDTVINAKSSKQLMELFKEQGVTKETQKVLIDLSVKLQEVTNNRYATGLLDDFVDKLKYPKELKDTIRSAMHSVLDHAKYQDNFTANAQMLTDEFVKNVQGYVTGSDMTLKSQSVDALMKRCAKKLGYSSVDQVENDILNIMKTFPDVDPADMTRHSALYDTTAQIYLYEKITGEKFSGYMLDTETTKLLNKRNKTNGALTEIAILHKDIDDNITVAFHKKIKATKETIENYYAQTKPTLELMKTTTEEYMAKHIADTDEYLEEKLLLDTYKFLKSLDPGVKMGTFNGEDFDIIYLDRRMKEVLGVRDIVATFNQLELQDYYKELSKDRFRFTALEQAQINNIFELIIMNNRQTLGKYRTVYEMPIKVVGGMDSGFIDIVKQSLDLDVLEMLSKKPKEDLIDMLDMFDENEFLEYISNMLSVAEIQKIGFSVFNSNIDLTVRKYLQDLLLEYIDTARNVGFVNDSLKALNIPGYVFDVDHYKNNKVHRKILKEIQDKIIDELPDGPQKTYLKEHALPATNLTQLLTTGIPGDPMYAYKKFRGELYTIWDDNIVPITHNNWDHIDDVLSKIVGTNDQLYNVQSIVPQKSKIYEMLDAFKARGLTPESQALIIDRDNLQFAYSELTYLWNALKKRVGQGYADSLMSEQFLSELQTKFPDLIKTLEDGTPFVKVSINNASLDFIRPDTYKWGSEITQKMELKAFKDLTTRNMQSVQALIEQSHEPIKILKECKTAGSLQDDLIEFNLKSVDRKIMNNIKQTNTAATNLRYAYALKQTLTLTPEQMLSELVYSSADHIKVISKPSSNHYFNNLDSFNLFLLNKKNYEDIGIKVVYDEDFQKIYLGLDANKCKLTLNKNNLDSARYCINGEPIAQHFFEPLTEDVFKAYVTGLPEYTDTMYKWMRTLEHIQPELRGRAGLTETLNNIDNMRIMNTFGEYNLSTALEGDNFIPYFSSTYVGEYADVTKDLGPLHSDILYSLGSASSKITTHTGKHVEYGMFVAQNGLSLESEVLQSVDPKVLNEWLNNNQDWVAVYLADAKRAVGGFELRRIMHFNEKTMAEAKRLRATIIPYRQYVKAAANINNYHYGNNIERIFGKISSAYKAGWLASTGVLFRNIIDSAMKNFIEGGEVSETAMRYVQAFDLYNKYTTVMREILDLDANHRYTLQNAKDYFARGNTLLTSEEYHFVYDFLNESGMNTLKTGASDMFDLAMKPMGYIEKINRLAMYLNLEDQGMEYNKIIRKIAETHFDYSTKTQMDFLAQIYIPFWTYASNNITYIAHLIDEHPTFLRNYFNFYTPMWDFDSINYEEYVENASLRNQIISGNLPLNKLFGYEDKEITRTIDTKYGPKEQTVTNTAVLKMGSSILDGLKFFVSPLDYFKEKLAPPLQVAIDTVMEYGDSALGNIAHNMWSSQEDSEQYYNYNFGSTSVQNLVKNPAKIMNLLPGLTAAIPNDNLRVLASMGLGTYNRYDQSKVYERTENELLSAIPSVFGATARWGEFTNKLPTEYAYPAKSYAGGYRKYPRKPKTAWKYYPKKYYPKKVYAKKSYANKFYAATPRPGQGVIYRSRPGGRFSTYYTGYTSRAYTTGKRPYSKYDTFIYNISHPNREHNRASSFRSSNMQSIPQYLYSFGGRNRQGNSKMLSWLRMPTRYKVKSTLRRYASP